MPHVRHRDTHPCASRGQRQSSDGSTLSRAHEDRRLPAGPVLLVLAVALALSVVLSLAFGTIRLPAEQAWHVLDVHVRGGSVEATADQIVWGLRLPRTVLAVVAGAGLSVGGAVMQTLVRNPLADPYMLGIPVTGLRVALFIVQAILVSAIVAVSGGIGFVGLVIPHLTRLLVGPRHRVVLPVSALFGALFLVWVDVLSRVASRPQETPLSIVTGLLGAPVFLLLLGRRHYQYARA